MENEENNKKEEESSEGSDSPDESSKNKTDIDIKLSEIRTATEAMNKASDKMESLLQTDAMTKAMGGQSDAGQVPVKPIPLTDTEYAEAMDRGEVNPLREDGFAN